MSSAVIQLLVLAGVALFLILRLRNVLGTREGFEKPTLPQEAAGPRRAQRPDFEVIEGGPDRDITDHVAEGTAAAESLARMKAVEPSFSVSEFLDGARQAYEMILMAFERGDLRSVRPFLSDDVHEAFAHVVDARADQGLTVEANFVGVREVTLTDAAYDPDTKVGEVTIKFVGELTSVVRDRDGDVVEGSSSEIKRQRDVWSFARTMGEDDPNWKLVATGG
jgi:predicted lipid-binding transport protein (Tim44 family)